MSLASDCRPEAQQKAHDGDPKANLEDRVWRKPQMQKFSHRQVALNKLLR